MPTASRDSAIGMAPTNGAYVDGAKERTLHEGKEANIQINENLAETDDLKEPDEIIYEIRYQNVAGEHLHSRPLKRRAHDLDESVLSQSPVM